MVTMLFGGDITFLLFKGKRREILVAKKSIKQEKNSYR
jgi:hypothetical protein